MCSQDAPEKWITPTTRRFLLKVCHWIKAVQWGNKDVKDMQEMLGRWSSLSVLFWVCVGALRAALLNISHGLEHNPDRSFGAVWWDGGGRDRAGEVFLNMRGSSSFRGMEGFKERRGEHSFKVLWRLAAVGRAAVFPKSPPNRKTGSFFSIAQEQPLPYSQKQGPALNSQGGKKPQIILLSAWNTRTVAYITLKHTRCWRTNTCSVVVVFTMCALTHTWGHIVKDAKACDSSDTTLSPHPFFLSLLSPPPFILSRQRYSALSDLCLKVRGQQPAF